MRIHINKTEPAEWEPAHSPGTVFQYYDNTYLILRVNTINVGTSGRSARPTDVFVLNLNSGEVTYFTNNWTQATESDAFRYIGRCTDISLDVVEDA